MLINADFSRRADLVPEHYRWMASPQCGVERVMLDRVGAEIARATSIVRYAPDSWFPRHCHPGGEEILVLSGTFSEGGAHYPAGWYMRNPPGSSHQPSSKEGAVLFVKLRQMAQREEHRVRIDTRDPNAWKRDGGREFCPLFANDVEHVCLRRLSPGEPLFGESVEGAELLVLTGEIISGDQSFGPGGWIRLPEGTYPEDIAGNSGASVYLKTGRQIGAMEEA
ncbi:cupin domain-containing protein [Paraburkholderia bryophila]|uniref:cupin domain-containing protein n=1 Tax=Paraburkholderia bryophila TaxID=420952 RepID=UPI00234A89C9|nr:cupin domain-containing protein [Paraburkholderia bryophila]WCM24565.1 cupin domain-containing protein [Paraburkholderia bryophila]